MKRIKTKVPFLRLGEISLTDLVICLVKNAWVVLLIALASAITAYSAVSASIPESYSSSMTLAVRNTQMTARWNDSFYIAKNYAQSLATAINDRTVSTDFASDELNNKLNVTVKAVPIDTTNLITLTASAPSPEEAYLYLLSLSEHIESFTGPSTLTNLSVEVASEPAMAEYVQNTHSLMPTLLAAAGGALLACVAIILIYYFRSPLATRKAARRLSVLPVAGTLNRSGKGRGLDARLPLVSSDAIDGCYVDRLSETADYLLRQPTVARQKDIRICPALLRAPKINATQKRRAIEEAERIALNLALLIAMKGQRVCLIDADGRALKALGVSEDSLLCGGNLTVLRSAKASATAHDAPDLLTLSVENDPSVDHANAYTLEVLSVEHASLAEGTVLCDPGVLPCTPKGLLLYGFRCRRDTVCERDTEGDAGEEKLSKTDAYCLNRASDGELDLLRWAITSLRALVQSWKGLVAALAGVTLAALLIGTFANRSSYRMDTVFTVVTADAASERSEEALGELSVESAVALMGERNDLRNEIVFNGNALYPTSRATEVYLLNTTLPYIWNSGTLSDTLSRQTDTPASVSVTMGEDDLVYTLTVRGAEPKTLEQMTEAFFEVAPKQTAFSAGGLTYVSDEPTLTADGISLSLILLLGWGAVIVIALGYALVAGYVDERIHLFYEVCELTGHRPIGVCRVQGRIKGENDAEASVDANLARFISERADQAPKGVLMIGSALRNEGSGAIAAAVKKQLEKKGCTIAITDMSALSDVIAQTPDAIEGALVRLRGEADYLLIDCPGFLLNSGSRRLAECTDGILWLIRRGYADARRVGSAIDSIEPKDKLLGIVWTCMPNDRR